MELLNRMSNAVRALFTLSASAGSMRNEGGPWIKIGGTIGDNFEENLRNLVIAYFACRRNVAEDMALMPFRILRSEGRMRIPIKDPLVTLLNTAPNPAMSAFSFRATLAGHMLDSGTGFAHIQWNKMTGKAAALWPVSPTRIRIEVRSTPANPYELVYWIRNNSGVETGPIPERDMLKVPGFSDDGILGFAMFKILANALASAWSTQNVTKNFFEHNATPGGVLEATQNIGDPERQALREHWAEHYSGPGNAGKILVLGAGLTYKALSQSFKDADLATLRSMTVNEIATGFRMPLRKLQIVLNAQGWATLDAQEADYSMSCLQPNATRFEQEIRRQLMGSARGYTEDDEAHFEMKGRLRGDLKTRMEYYKGLFFMGCITPNEIRALEDLNPILAPGMDVTYVQGATIPLALAGQMKAAGVEPTKPDDVEPPEPKDDEEETDPPAEPGANRLKNGNGVHHG